MTVGVYQIKNTDNGKSYIGSSMRLERRLSEHKSRLRHNKHGNRHLQRAWNKYGKDAFEFEVLAELDTDIDILRLIERMYLYNLEPEYCMSMYPTRNYMYGRTGDKHPNYGRVMFRQPHSEESKRRISESKGCIDRQAVLDLHEMGQYNQKEIADIFNVGPSYISHIVCGRRKIW